MLTVLAKLSETQIVAIATKYGIVQLQSCSVRDVLGTFSKTMQ